MIQMNKSLKKSNVTKLAKKHAEYVLDFDNILCQSLCKNDFFKGALCFSYAQTEIDISQRKELTSGGITPKISEYLSSYLIEKYSENESMCILLDDVMMRPNDDILNVSGVNSFQLNNQVYHWCSLGSMKENDLNKLIWATNVSWHFLGLVFTLSNISNKTNNVYITKILQENLQGLDIMEVVLGAYDGEGFVHYVN
jgi:hypothetical protein